MPPTAAEKNKLSQGSHLCACWLDRKEQTAGQTHGQKDRSSWLVLQDTPLKDSSRECSRGAEGSTWDRERTSVHLPAIVARSPWKTEPQALPPTEKTGNLREKAQVAGGQAQGTEADRLLTLAYTGSGTPTLARDDAAEVIPSHPCSVLELPPAWPLGCGTHTVPAFCLVCFHREEEEEEPLEEVPLRRSVPGWAVGGRGAWRGCLWTPVGLPLATHLHLPAQIPGPPHGGH